MNIFKVMREVFRRTFDWLSRAVTQPRSELDRWERAIRFCHDLTQYGTKQLRRDRAPQMAGALTFRTLFGLLPVLVVAALVVRMLRGSEAFVSLVQSGIKEAHLFEIGTPGNTLGDLLVQLVRDASAFDATAIGWIGLAVLMYSAISLMVTIENCFNTVYHAPEGRSWTRRFPMYWTVLTVGPVVIGVSLFVNSRVGEAIGTLEAWQWLVSFGAAAWGFLVTWLFTFAVYSLVPNTSVRLRASAIGALVAAILLTIGKQFLGVYLSHVVAVTQFGGRLGLVPLFMFWIYLMWLFILFGLQVAATLQRLAGRSLDEVGQPGDQGTGLVDPASILSVMECIAVRFGKAAPAIDREISDKTGLPEATVRLMLRRLEEAGIVHRLHHDDHAVGLARPPEAIAASELMEIGFALVDEATSRPSSIRERLRDAQRNLASGSMLADLLGPSVNLATPKPDRR